MSFNGSGVAVINSAGQPVSANTLIEASVFNAFTADVATMLSTCVTKDGQSTVTANLPMAGNKFTGLAAGSTAGDSLRYEQLFTTSGVQLLGAMNWVKGADVASDTTINLTTATGNGVHVTGTTTITGVTLGSGIVRLVVFDGALTLTHNATTNNLPGAANITTAAGDRAIYWADGTTVYCMFYMPAAGYQSKMTAASQGEMEAGTESALRSMSPLRVAQAIAALAPAAGIPQNSQNASYTLVLADSGKHINMATAGAFTIPANSSVAFPVGTAISFYNPSASSTIAITSDTLRFSGVGTTGTRTIAQYGTATILKVATTTWVISGSGLT
jgi:hypothetical protein